MRRPDRGRITAGIIVSTLIRPEGRMRHFYPIPNVADVDVSTLIRPEGRMRRNQSSPLSDR